MMKRISLWLHNVSTGWVALAALAIFLLFTALVLPRQAAQSEAETGEAGSPDTSLFYAPDDLYRWAEAYGPAGRAAYIRARLTFDVIWPLVYTAFLSTAIAWIYGKAFAADSRWRRMNLAPVLGALFDYLENATAALVIWRYPARTPIIDMAAPVFTLVKWIFVGGSFAVLALGVAVAMWRWGKRG